MEKTRKKILGFLCLIATIAITIVAASIPSANTSAGTNTYITLRVVGPTPDITITESPESIIPSAIPIVINKNQAVKFICDNVDSVNAGLIYTPFNNDPSAIVSEQIFSSFENYEACEHTLNLDLSQYGYGNFLINIQGDGDIGFDEDSVTFDYSSLAITANQDEPGEDPIVELFYDDEVVDKIIITVYDENGNVVPGLEAIEVSSGTHEVELPFAENDVKSGNYIVKATPYDEDGNIVPNKAQDSLTYIAPDLEVPNTGGPLGMLNLSRSDYLMTGVIVFIAFGAVAIFFLKKSKKTTKKR